MSIRRSGAAPLLFIVLIAFGALAGVLVKGWTPQLGLDLQGGASVVLQAVPTADGEAVTAEQRDTALEIIRSRVDALGVAEPEIVGQDSDLIVVNLPGVTDPCRALEVIRSTAELRFRPVLRTGTYFDPNAPTTTVSTPDTTAGDGTTTIPGTGTTGTTTGTTGTIAPTSTTTAPVEETSTTQAAAGGPGLGAGEFAGVLPVVAAGPTTTTTVPTTATTAPPATTTATTAVTPTTASGTPTTVASTPTTAIEGDPCERDTDDATSTTPTTGSTESTGSTGTSDTTGSTTTTPEATTTTVDESTTTLGAAGAPGLAEGEYAGVLQTGGTESTTTVPAPTTTAEPPPTTAVDPSATSLPASTTAPPLTADDITAPICILDGTSIVATTTKDLDVATANVVLPDKNGQQCYELGAVPTDGTISLVGSIIQDPSVSIVQGEWQVDLTIAGDALALFNQMSSACYNRQANCPTSQLAIAVDGTVQSAPAIQAPSFDDGTLQISGSFGEQDARDLALILRFGALPVELEPLNFNAISPTLGRDSLRAGLIAGFAGLALVVLYMLVYYRALGVVVLLGLSVWSALLYSIICWLGESRGLALSLAGVTGIIVSVGVTVDSYVVYFERLKDEIRSGKTIRSSVDRGFQRAFRTILTADISSFIGAALLYLLTVGAVRGFAFFLGLSTLLDVVVAYFFTRPLVARLGRSGFFTRSRRFGVARGLGVRQTEAVA